MQMTATAQLIEHKLGRSLANEVKTLQEGGLGWRRIAHQIREETGFAVSHESLRSWFATKDAA